MNKSIYIIDIETDGLSYQTRSIVEIGIVQLNLDTEESYPIFDSITKEDKDIDSNAWIFINSNLKYKEVCKAEKLDSFKEPLQKLFLKGSFTAFNQKFDFNWLESRKFRIPNKFEDPMLTLTPIMRLPHPYYNIKYPSVTEAYYFLFNKVIIEPHRAIEDAYIETEIILEMYKRNYFKKGEN